ncbi:UNVERIFIED_CONTAM: hypothetical protein K2H54_009072, partial [Gekko kuhli]
SQAWVRQLAQPNHVPGKHYQKVKESLLFGQNCYRRGLLDFATLFFSSSHS